MFSPMPFMGESTGMTTRVMGTVKWFDPTKGYGFVKSPQLSSDALLHASALRVFNASEIFDGAQIEVDVRETDKGFAVETVLMLETRDAQPLDNFTIAVVKWYNVTKGYGFVTRGEGTRDLFLHAETVKDCGLVGVQPGQAVYIQYEENEKGGRVTNVRERGPKRQAERTAAPAVDAEPRCQEAQHELPS
jgi:CspA family cold shock protein